MEKEGRKEGRKGREGRGVRERDTQGSWNKGEKKVRRYNRLVEIAE